MPAITAAAKTLDAEAAIGPSLESMRLAFTDAVKAAAFGLGIEILPPAELRLDSPTLRRAAEVLQLFANARQQAPDVPAGVLIDRLADDVRGDVVGALLSAQPVTDASFVAVAGDALLTVSGEEPPRIRRLPPTLGPARSVTRLDANVLAVGCRGGVWLIEGHAEPTPLAIETDDAAGFNAACRDAAGRVVATHSKLGLTVWHGNQPQTVGVDRLRGSARCPLPLNDGRLALLAGNQLVAVDGDDVQLIDLLPIEGVALLPLDRRLVAVTAAGDVHLYDGATLAPEGKRATGCRVRHATVLPLAGSGRLVLATDAGVELFGPDDGLARRLPVAGGTRAVAAEGGQIAAVAGDRQKLLIVPATLEDEPREVPLASLAGHRVGDVAD